MFRLSVSTSAGKEKKIKLQVSVSLLPFTSFSAPMNVNNIWLSSHHFTATTFCVQKTIDRSQDDSNKYCDQEIID